MAEVEKPIQEKMIDLYWVFVLLLVLLFIGYLGPVPVFGEMFAEFGREELPFLTRTILGAAEILSAYLLVWVPLSAFGLVMLGEWLGKAGVHNAILALRILILFELLLGAVSIIGLFLPMQQGQGVVGA